VTLLEAAIQRARLDPGHRTVILVAEDGSEETITAAALLQGAAGYAGALRGAGVSRGDVVILVMRHSRELLLAFWGALHLGAVPSIFPFLSEKLDPALYARQVRALISHSGARAIIAGAEFVTLLQELLEGSDCRVIASDQVTAEHAGGGLDPVESSEDDIAFLQHSSGSTGLQKGVAVSHRAVLHQVRSYAKAIALADDVVVSWLPLYHDMGLVACGIMPVVMGVPLVLISPFHWVRDPAVLFRAVQRHGGTISWLPNFAYNHCARIVRDVDLEGVDLSRWRVVNCSEPVRYESHRLFVERFRPQGFSERALGTCYAMAEATFAVTSSPATGPPRVDWVELPALQGQRRAVPAAANTPGSVALTSSGSPIEGVEVEVIGEDGAALPPRRLGEIRIRGACLFAGYHRRPDLTAAAIKDGWYHSGDMGYLADGELYVLGRKDDLIIVGGRNIYPGDLEAIAAEVPGLRAGRAAAFGVADERLGTEAIVMVCELAGSASASDVWRIESDLRTRIVRSLDVTLADVRLVDDRWLVKTSSGKVARRANREKYLQSR
jgi:acyl-CoA synthetase (AMP-forming)/AMP-acid ligase II